MACGPIYQQNRKVIFTFLIAEYDIVNIKIDPKVFFARAPTAPVEELSPLLSPRN